MCILRLCCSRMITISRKNYDRRSVYNSTLRKMKKIIPLLLISFSIATQSLNAQLDLAFVSNFSANPTNSSNRLTWTIASNQSVNSFEVEKSTNGKDFKTIAVLSATEKFNTENYTYADTAISSDKIMYRRRILINRSQNDFYSRIIFVQSKM